MRAGQSSVDKHEYQRKAPGHLPGIFKYFAVIGILCVAASIAVSVVMAPAHDPMFHFREEGLITALAAVCLSMAGAVSIVVFYLRLKDWSPGTVFWLILAAGCVFLALDEQLRFHELGGTMLDLSSIGQLGSFHTWNDIIVIIYGLLAMAIAAFFGREILASRQFAVLFVVGFAFYAIHTAIDSTLPNSLTWKDIPEEGAKLASVYFLFLATGARLVMLVETSWRHQPGQAGVPSSSEDRGVRSSMAISNLTASNGSPEAT